MCSPLESGEMPSVHVNPDASFEPVRDYILDLQERVEDLCNQELSKITKQGGSLLFTDIYMVRIFFNHIVSSLSVNDTTLFTLGDGEFHSLPFFQ